MKIFKLQLSESKKFIGSVVHGSRFRAETIINEMLRKMNVISFYQRARSATADQWVTFGPSIAGIVVTFSTKF